MKQRIGSYRFNLGGLSCDLLLAAAVAEYRETEESVNAGRSRVTAGFWQALERNIYNLMGTL